MESLTTEDVCQIGEIKNVIFIVIILLISGIIGGIINCITQNDTEFRTENTMECRFCYSMRQCLFLGIGASLLVPLFLETISSSLINDAQIHPKKYLVIMGFAIVSAITAPKFIRNISNIALKSFEDIKRTAVQANEKATVIDSILRAQNTNIDPYVALSTLEKEMKDNSEMREYAGAWAWKGYYQKRIGKYDDAVHSLKNAISLSEKHGIHNWMLYYNSACYMALAKYDVKNVFESLKKAFELNPKEVKFNLQDDHDFNEMKQSPEFIKLVEPLIGNGNINN